MLARYWTDLGDGRLQCDLCPRECRVRDGQRGFCFVRKAEGGAMVLDTYGRSSGFCIDPIEKKPLNHFLPGTPVLSFGTAGCNLACKFCQNHEISKSREVDTLSAPATPEALARAARQTGCRSIAYTYNDPVIFLEYAVDVARAARAEGIANVAVTAGYISAPARPEFFAEMDAANIDLKAFSEDFYRRLTASELAPVLETIEYVVKETPCWVELTCLVIPGENDSDRELDAMAEWVAGRLGPEVPMHLTAFHPDFRMPATPRTPPGTLLAARRRMRAAGLRHVYVGNMRDREGQSTWCTGCGAAVIVRDWHSLVDWRLDDHGACSICDTPVAGVFDGPPGDWGARRQRVRIAP